MTTGTIAAPKLRPAVLIPTLLLHVGALFALLPSNFSWSAVGVAVLLHTITIGLGISLGFHRLASHRSFKVPQWLEYFFILCGTLAGQGAVLGWVGYHRLHHLHVDTDLDPHDSTKGFLWCHISWLMHEVPHKEARPKYTRDINGDRFYRFCHDYYIHLQVLLGVALYFMGGTPWVVWGIFARLFVGFHSTCFVNSVCHMIGYRSHNTDDQSTNCWWVSILTFGEGWHNNHHAVQYSARFGWNWWEIDMVWYVVWALEKVGLATNVKASRTMAKAT